MTSGEVLNEYYSQSWCSHSWPGKRFSSIFSACKVSSSDNWCQGSSFKDRWSVSFCFKWRRCLINVWSSNFWRWTTSMNTDLNEDSSYSGLPILKASSRRFQCWTTRLIEQLCADHHWWSGHFEMKSIVFHHPPTLTVSNNCKAIVFVFLTAALREELNGHLSASHTLLHKPPLLTPFVPN